MLWILYWDHTNKNPLHVAISLQLLSYIFNSPIHYVTLRPENLMQIANNNFTSVTKKKGKKYAPLMVLDYSDLIYMLAGVDVINDEDNVHPMKLCRPCYHVMLHSKRNGQDGLLQFTDSTHDKINDINKINKLWKAHEEHGGVCDRYHEQMKPGKPVHQ